MQEHYKILYCIPTLGCGGAERQLSYLAPELAHKGNEVHVAYHQGGINLKRLQNSPVHLHQLKAASNYDPRILWDLLRLVQNLHPDLIQTWIFQMDVLGGLAALIRGTPLVLREPASIKAWPPNSWKNFPRKWVGCAATAIIANSQGGAECWQSWGFPGPMFVIGNALPLIEIEGTAPTRFLKNDPEHREKFLLYVGRLEDQQKNIYKLIQALLMLSTEGNVKAILCGDGPERVRIKAYLSDFGAEDKILLPGVVNNVWGLMKACDVFISVSHYEGLPNSVLEAMACGCPLVVSDIPAHREFLSEQSAVLVNHLEPAAIAAGLREVLENPEAAQARAKIALEIVSGRTISAMANQYEEVYQKILAR